MTVKYNRVLTLMLLMIAFAFSANAEPKTTVILKNGSKIIGDIIVQRPGIDLTIDGVRAELVIEDASVKSIKKKDVKYETLSREWKRWALEKKALKGDAYGRYLEMYDIKTKQNNYTRVVKTTREESPKNIYLQVEKSTYKFDWGMIDEIQKSTSSEDDVTGVDDEVMSIYGKRYRGTIVSQKIGKNIIIKTKDNRAELKMYEIVETKSVPRSLSFTLGEQADYTNIIVLNDGVMKDGVIIAKHYGKKESDQYILLLRDNGKKEKVLMSQIAEYRTSYVKKGNNVYKDGAIYVNEFRTNKAAVKTENGMNCYVDKKIFPFPEGIAITFKTRGAALQGPWNIIALENVEMTDGASTYGYDDNIKKNNTIKPSSRDMTDGISSITFAYLSPGYYALVNDDGDASYIIKIVK